MNTLGYLNQVICEVTLHFGSKTTGVLKSGGTMNNRVDLALLLSTSAMKGDNPEDTRLLKSMFKEARRYLLSFNWCREIKKSWFGWGVGGVCAVFLFEIIPAKKNVDRWLWVVVGDLPSAYLVLDGNSTPMKALDTYVELMQEWVEAVKQGKRTNKLIPVDAPETMENADLLERRLAFLRKKVLY